MSRHRHAQLGQGVIELALVLPILVMMLAAAGYVGFAVTTQQRLAIAARQAARAVAAASSQANEQGVNHYVIGIGGGTYQTAAASALQGFAAGRITVTRPGWTRFGLAPLGAGFAALFRYSNPQAKTSPPFVAGCVFYGCTLNYRLTELDWLATLMGLRGTGLTVSATCVMPGELPMRGYAPEPFGLLDLNQGLIKQAADNPLKDPKLTNLLPWVPSGTQP